MQTQGPPKEQWRDDALSLVEGWRGGIVESMQNTPTESINRNRIVDRQEFPFPLMQHLMFV